MKKLLQALFLSYILLLTGYSEVELKKLSRITLKNYFYSVDFLQKSNSNNSTVDIYITIKYNLIKDNVIIFLLGGLNTMKLTKTNPQHESLEVY